MKGYDNPYQNNLMALRGFCDGAGAKPINPRHAGNDYYINGYSDGQRAKHDYAGESAKKFGVTIREIMPL